MIFYVKLISIVIAVSLDGFGVGVTYGMRKIKIPFNALFIIVLCSGTIVMISMLIGHLLRLFISPTFTSIIGSAILIALGLFVLFTMLQSRFKNRMQAKKQGNTFSHFKTVLSKPASADKDRSGTISMKEALVLGTALALDAFGAGLGASMLGYSALLTAGLIATMSGLFVFTGLKVGFLLSKNKRLAKLTFLPPIILITIGLYNLF